MKIKANNANSPVWKDVHAHSVLPAKLEPLREIAYNLWWVWNYEATRLFNKIVLISQRNWSTLVLSQNILEICAEGLTASVLSSIYFSK